MLQNIIVFILIALSVVFFVKTAIRKSKSDGCEKDGQCEGCELYKCCKKKQG